MKRRVVKRTERTTRARPRLRVTRRSGWCAVLFAACANAGLFAAIALLNDRDEAGEVPPAYTVREVYRAPPPPPPFVEVQPPVAEPEPRRLVREQPELLPLTEDLPPPAPRQPRLAPVALTLDVLPTRVPALTVGGNPNAPAFGGADGQFALGDVDGEPRLVSGVSPAYPLWARRRGIEGSALLRFVVGAEGRVSQVRVVSTEGSARFGDVARRTIETWRFEPATKDGRPVAVKCQQRVEFRLR